MRLPDQSLLTTKMESTPAEFAAMLRERGPVYWWPRGNFWLVTDYRIAEAALKNPDLSCDRSSFFVSRMPNLDLSLIKDFFGVVGKMMVMSDAPAHTARRKIAALGVTDELLDYFNPMIEKTVRELVDRAAEKGHMDFVSDVAHRIPSIVLADLFHIREEEREDFYRWSNNMTQFFGGASQYRNEDGVEVNHSAASIRDYFVRLAAERRKAPKGDFLSIMLENQERFGLTDEELISQAVMMLVAGQVTTTDQICNDMYQLLTQPGALDEVRACPSLVKPALEELNRLDPAVTFIFRVAKRETTLGAHVVKEGGVVFISTHAVNRDPAVFADPDRCIVSRSPNPHFAYGYGTHFCLGAKLARMEMQAVFTQLLERFPRLALDSARPARRKHHSLAFSGFESLALSLGDQLPETTRFTYALNATSSSGMVMP